MPELDGPNPVAGIYGRMAQFEPGTQGQAAIHQTALKQFDSFVAARRTRLYRVSSGMPHVMWYTVALGALINMIFLWVFDLGVSTHPAWRTRLVLHRDHDLRDRDSRHSFQGRNRRVA
jgi:hypothetical protein